MSNEERYQELASKGSIQVNDLIPDFKSLGLVEEVYPAFQGEVSLRRAWVSENVHGLRVVTIDEGNGWGQFLCGGQEDEIEAELKIMKEEIA